MDKEEKQKLSKVIDATVGVTLAMEMTPEQRAEALKAGFDYTKRTRRMPSLSEACIMYLAQEGCEQPPDRQKGE